MGPQAGWQGLDRELASSLEVTRREEDVLGAVVARLTNAEVAATLFISKRTVEPHVSSLLRKLDARDRSELIERARALAADTSPLGVVAARLVPLPARLAVRPPVGVVGRSAELAVVDDCVKRVAADGGRDVVVVSGEAGVGKTTLIAEAATVAFDGGACVLFGHCEEDLATPYQLFAEALGSLVDHTPDDELTSLVDGDGEVLAGLLPGLTRRMPRLGPSTAPDADTGRYQLFAAVAELLARLSAQQPVVLVLEDLQWADRASLQLLRHVVGSDRPLRLVVLGSCRDRELTRSHPMADTLAELHRLGRITRVDLVGLDDAGVAAFIEAAGGQALDDAALVFAAEVHRETGGNPFFVGAVLRHLADAGALARDEEGRWSATMPLDQMSLPPSVHAVIGGRVGRLGGDAERVLSVAAVIGRDFDLNLLTAACGLADDDVLAVLDAAAAAALVGELADPPGHYIFVHALIQHTLYAQLGRTRQARTHRQVAAALEALRGDRPGARVGELARHWSAAPRPDALPKALEYTRRAADEALAALAPGDALAYYTQALALHQQRAERDPLLDVDLRIGLGIAQRQTGHAEFRETLLGAARQAADLGDNDRLAAAALANNRGGLPSAGGAVDGDKVDILELALQRVPVAHSSRPLLLAKLCSELTYNSDLQRRENLADEAITLARATGDDATIVRVLNDVSWSLRLPQLLEQSLQRTAEALQRAGGLGDPVLLWWAASLHAGTCMRGGAIAEMKRCYAIAWTLADRLDQPTLNWQRAHTRACALLAGDTSEAEARAIEALDIGTRSGQPDARLVFGGQIHGVCTQRGVFPDDRVAFLEKARTRAPALRDSITAGLALEYARVGRLELAHELLDQFAGSGFQPPPDPGGRLVTMIHYTDVAIACDEHHAAAALYEWLVPYADQFPTDGVVPYAPVDQYLGRVAALLGRYERAGHHFTRAAELAERAGAAYFATEIDLAWGQMFLQRRQAGDDERAHARLDSARSAATAGGYADVERRATEALHRLG